MLQRRTASLVLCGLHRGKVPPEHGVNASHSRREKAREQVAHALVVALEALRRGVAEGPHKRNDVLVHPAPRALVAHGALRLDQQPRVDASHVHAVQAGQHAHALPLLVVLAADDAGRRGPATRADRLGHVARRNGVVLRGAGGGQVLGGDADDSESVDLLRRRALHGGPTEHGAPHCGGDAGRLAGAPGSGGVRGRARGRGRAARPGPGRGSAGGPRGRVRWGRGGGGGGGGGGRGRWRAAGHDPGGSTAARRPCLGGGHACPLEELLHLRLRRARLPHLGRLQARGDGGVVIRRAGSASAAATSRFRRPPGRR
mmetsp:Transcript_976/g.3741  ORF Transcript_976/g.3741 Transcript_976/m.3741 type:complete len:315 (-) Transcript_976:390-1334(-)